MTHRRVSLLQFITIAASIIIVFGTVSLFFLSNQIAQSRDSQRKADIEIIRTSLFDYYTDHNCFPKTIPDCHNFNRYDHTEYFSNYHCDPKGLNYIYEPQNLSCPLSFEIFTSLENQNDPDITKTNCSDGCGPGCKFNYSTSDNNTPMIHDCPSGF